MNYISALNASATSTGNFVIILQEAHIHRKLPIIIGLQEAQAIAVAPEQMQPIRPLTHDLLLNSLSALEAKLEHVKICTLHNGSFHAVIVSKNKDGDILEIDSHTSDGHCTGST